MLTSHEQKSKWEASVCSPRQPGLASEGLHSVPMGTGTRLTWSPLQVVAEWGL